MFPVWRMLRLHEWFISDACSSESWNVFLFFFWHPFVCFEPWLLRLPFISSCTAVCSRTLKVIINKFPLQRKYIYSSVTFFQRFQHNVCFWRAWAFKGVCDYFMWRDGLFSLTRAHGCNKALTMKMGSSNDWLSCWFILFPSAW